MKNKLIRAKRLLRDADCSHVSMVNLIEKKDHNGVIIALYPDEESTDKLYAIAQQAFGEDAVSKDDLHLTIKYFDRTDDVNNCFDCLARALFSIAIYCKPVEAIASGIGRFFNDDDQAVYISIDSQDAAKVYESVCREVSYNTDPMMDAGDHGFDPHVTIGYADNTPDVKFDQFMVRFTTAALCYGDSKMTVPLLGRDPEAAMSMGKAISRDMVSSSLKAVWTTAYVNNLPDSAFLFVESGGKKDTQGKTTPRSKRHFPYRDSSGKIDLPHLRNAIARIPQSNAPGLNKAAVQARARKLLGSSKKKSTDSLGISVKSSLTVFKQSSGKLRWILFSSNPYKDKDDEYVTQLAHEKDIKILDEHGYDGQMLRIWHIGDPYFEVPGDWTTVKAGPGVDVGVCDFAAMHGRIRVESGTFFDEEVGKSIADCSDELEASLAFAHPSREPDKRGGFLNIKSFERSLTPRNMASNLFTALLVNKEMSEMDAKKLKAFKGLGVDIDTVLKTAEKVQRKADKTAPYRMKSAVAEIEEEQEVDDDDIAAKLDRLTAQMNSLQQTMKEGASETEEEEKLEDLLVSELTVGELTDIISESIKVKSADPVGIALKAVMEEIEEIKSILTSKSVQSVVDDVARIKAKLERQGARLKATASRVRDLDDEQPRILRKGIRPSTSEGTLLDDDEMEEIAEKQQQNGSNPFSWIDEFIQKPDAGR